MSGGLVTVRLLDEKPSFKSRTVPLRFQGQRKRSTAEVVHEPQDILEFVAGQFLTNLVRKIEREIHLYVLIQIVANHDELPHVNLHP